MIGACTFNCWTLDHLVKSEPTIGVALTLAQFMSVTLCLLPIIVWRGLFRGMNPCQYGLTAGIFLISSVLNNYTFAYKLSVGTQSLLRSSNILLVELTSVLLGRKAYSRKQMLACGIVYAGLCILGWSMFDPNDMLQFKGLFLVMVSTGVGVILTQVQRVDDYVESTFWTHALGLPLFYGLQRQIPTMSPNLVLNMVTQVGCILGVNMLFTKYSRTQVAILLTIRKILTVIVSTWVNPTLPLIHVILASMCVFGGSLMYSF